MWASSRGKSTQLGVATGRSYSCSKVWDRGRGCCWNMARSIAGEDYTPVIFGGGTQQRLNHNLSVRELRNGITDHFLSLRILPTGFSLVKPSDRAWDPGDGIYKGHPPSHRVVWRLDTEQQTGNM